MARPRKEQDAQRRNFTLRLSSEERAALRARARSLNATPSDVLRAAFLSAPANEPAGPAHPPADPALAIAFQANRAVLVELIQHLKRIGNNMNQLSRTLHATDTLPAGVLPEEVANCDRCLARLEQVALALMDLSGTFR